MEFEFTEENKILVEKEINKYPKNRQQSAVMALLTIAQKQNNNYLSKEAIEHIAKILNMPVLKVMEVATFYTMYNLTPVGKYHIQVCSNVVCHVKGANSLLQKLEEATGTTINGKTSVDNLFTISKVECLGACANAPVIQINEDYYEDLTENDIEYIINELKNNNIPNCKKIIKSPNNSSEIK